MLTGIAPNRSVRLAIALALAFGLALAACSSGDTASTGATGAGGSTPTAKNLPCDVSAVLQAQCQSCHGASPTYGSPMPLATYADLTAPAKSDATKLVYELVGTRIHDDAHPMPQAPNPRLDAKDAATLDAWIAAKAPSSSESCSGSSSSTSASTGAGGSAPQSCTPDLKLRGEAWTMPKDTGDIYTCFGVDVTPGQKKQIVGIYPGVDNATIVHHMLLYQMPSTVSPTPAECMGGGGQGARLLAVWAPGGEGLAMPPEAGLPLDGTQHYMVQIHYSNLNHLDGQTDKSGFDLCTTTELRPHDADIMAVGTMSFSIPAHASLDVTCDLQVPAKFPAVHAFAGMPHMHKLGTAISATLLPASGPNVDLGTRAPWSFDAQYWSNDATTISPGDTVRTRCQWQNPGDTPVSFGEKTSDEMCFAFVAYWPKIETNPWSWMLPALSSKCSPTP